MARLSCIRTVERISDLQRELWKKVTGETRPGAMRSSPVAAFSLRHKRRMANLPVTTSPGSDLMLREQVLTDNSRGLTHKKNEEEGGQTRAGTRVCPPFSERRTSELPTLAGQFLRAPGAMTGGIKRGTSPSMRPFPSPTTGGTTGGLGIGEKGGESISAGISFSSTI